MCTLMNSIRQSGNATRTRYISTGLIWSFSKCPLKVPCSCVTSRGSDACVLGIGPVLFQFGAKTYKSPAPHFRLIVGDWASVYEVTFDCVFFRFTARCMIYSPLYAVQYVAGKLCFHFQKRWETFRLYRTKS